MRIFKGSLPYPGLVVTRSLGDKCATKLGVTNEPDIFKYQLERDDSILLATDGLWDGVEVEEAAKLARAKDNAVEAASGMMEYAINSLLQKQLDDNITVILIKNPI